MMILNQTSLKRSLIQLNCDEIFSFLLLDLYGDVSFLALAALSGHSNHNSKLVCYLLPVL